MSSVCPHEALIFVDVDGVLNVGIRDGNGTSPLILNEANRERAERMLASGAKEGSEVAQKIQSVARSATPMGEPFVAAMSPSSCELCKVPVRNLADVLRAAPESRSVILSSSWRKPQHKTRANRLETLISDTLGKPFQFDGTTRIYSERGAADRLECIGDYLADLRLGCVGGTAGQNPKAPLKVVLLEDFFVTPLSGWAVGGFNIESEVDVARYLQFRAGGPGLIETQVIHTYAEYTDPNGQFIQVGTSITPSFAQKAKAFLRGEIPGIEVPSDNLTLKNSKVRSALSNKNVFSLEGGENQKGFSSSEESQAIKGSVAKPRSKGFFGRFFLKSRGETLVISAQG